MNTKNLPKNLPSHFPKSKKEEAEFGKGKKDVLVCKKCNAVYWYKSWHHRLQDYPELSEKIDLKFTICPACQMVKDKKYEGEVVLEGVPEKLTQEVMNTVKNIGDEAYKRDCQDRIISVQKTNKGSGMRILTTENQLAVQLAKKLSQTFKGSVKIQYSKEESVVRIKVFWNYKA